VSTRTGRRDDHRLIVYVDADCGVCTFVAIWLARLDVLRRLRLVRLQDAPAEPGMPPQPRLLETMHARDAEGRWWTGAAACLQIARRVPALWPFALLGRIPAVARLMERGYTRIARDRRQLSVRLGLAVCRLPDDAHARSGGDHSTND
jgi:predicted DCC family thiol-disulfide oxidoreductase YuxK